MKARIVLVDNKPQVEILDDAGKAVAKVDPELPEGYAIEDVGALRSALSSERKAAKDAAAKLKAFEGIDDPDAARDALEKVKSGSLKGSKELDEAKAAIEAKFAKDRLALDAEKRSLEEQLGRHLLDGAAAAAIAEHKGKLKALMPLVKQQARVERAEDGTRRVVIVGDDGKPLVTKKQGSAEPMGLPEFIAQLKLDPDLAGNFEGSGTGGSGARRSAGGSERGGHEDLTNATPEQMLIAHHSRT